MLALVAPLFAGLGSFTPFVSLAVATIILTSTSMFMLATFRTFTTFIAPEAHTATFIVSEQLFRFVAPYAPIAERPTAQMVTISFDETGAAQQTTVVEVEVRQATELRQEVVQAAVRDAAVIQASLQDARLRADALAQQATTRENIVQQAVLAPTPTPLPGVTPTPGPTAGAAPVVLTLPPAGATAVPAATPQPQPTAAPEVTSVPAPTPPPPTAPPAPTEPPAPPTPPPPPTPEPPTVVPPTPAPPTPEPPTPEPPTPVPPTAAPTAPPTAAPTSPPPPPTNTPTPTPVPGAAMFLFPGEGVDGAFTVGNLVPGQSTQFAVAVRNDSGLGITYTLTIEASSSSLLDQHPTQGLQLQVLRCADATFSSCPEIVYSGRVIIPASAAHPMGGPDTVGRSGARGIAPYNPAAGKGADYLVFRFNLPGTAANSFQGLSSTLTFTLRATEAT